MNIFRVSVKQNKLCFSHFEEDKSITNFINSNNIYNNELLYSFSYVNKYINKVGNALVKLVDSMNVNEFVFETNEIASLFIPSLKDNFKSIEIVIEGYVSICKELGDKLINVKYLKSVKCYFMPENYVRKFGSRGVSVYFTFNETFSNKFVQINKLRDMKDMYYKRNITITSDTLSDLEKFLTINKHLSVIHIYEYSLELMCGLIKIVGNRKCSVLIHQNEENIQKINSDFKNLRVINKSYAKSSKGEIKIVYSDNFVRNNLFKQLTYSNLKLCSIIIFYLAFVVLISNAYNDYVTWFNTNNIMNSLSTNEIISSDILVTLPEDAPIIDDEVKEEVNPYEGIPTQFERLVNINKDTVGWLTVNNTKINYPVTQSGDNDYYLNRDFYGRRTANGWIFMDYRNDAVNLSKNTIIYGHSLLSGYMFGELHDTRKSEWYKNKDNLIITFNTLGREMKWEVFSVYRTNYTTDYLKVNFYNDESFMNFIDLIKSRSVYNFGVKVDAEDYIITLSTCGSNNSRMVLHAKLIG